MPLPPRSTVALIALTSFFGTQGQVKSFLIDTRPSGALVFVNGTGSGTTPFKYAYTKVPTTPVIIELRKEGYAAQSVDLVMILKHAFAAKRPLTVNLYNERPLDRQRTDLPVVTLVNTIPEAKKDYGRIGATKLSTRSRELTDLAYPEQLTSDILVALRTSFANVGLARKGTQKGDEAIRRAKVYLQPVLKDVLVDLEENDGSVFGTVEVDMTWRFLSGIDTDSVLFSLDRRTSWPAFMEPERTALNSAIRDAAHQMIGEEGLQDRLARVFSEGLIRSKGVQVEVVTPKGIAFEGRKDMLAALVKGVVTIKAGAGHGSGFLISNDGYIVTNAHVVGDAGTVTVRFNQGFSLDGQVVKVNRDFDLALIKTPGNDLPALTLGDDAALLIGEELFAIGTPLDEQLGQTVTRGIMSGRREFEGRSFIQTDVSINAGNSGGPLIDESGKVVGVTTLKVTEKGVQGIGFAVPAGRMLEMLNIRFVEH